MYFGIVARVWHAKAIIIRVCFINTVQTTWQITAGTPTNGTIEHPFTLRLWKQNLRMRRVWLGHTERLNGCKLSLSKHCVWYLSCLCLDGPIFVLLGPYWEFVCKMLPNKLPKRLKSWSYVWFAMWSFFLNQFETKRIYPLPPLCSGTKKGRLLIFAFDSFMVDYKKMCFSSGWFR